MTNTSRMQKAARVLQALNVQHVHKGQNHAAVERRIGFGIEEIDQCLEGGLVANTLHEVRCLEARDMGAAYGFVLSLLARLTAERPGRVLWVCDPAASLDGGQLFPAGLEQYGFDPADLTLIAPEDLKTAMWAADEAVRCRELVAVVFQVRGNPHAFNMTATRRLMMHARQSGTFACLLRQSGEEEASAAATRWHVRAAPSLVDENFEPGIGHMRHVLTLERNRNGQCGSWLFAWNHKSRTYEAAQTTHIGHRLSPSCNGPHRPGKMGQVVDFERAS